MNKTFKIKSRFYVITGDDEPIYVGYTNRTVKQRFREHLRDKDFSDYNFVEVSELSDYEKDFDFTWNYLTIQKDAIIVDNVEKYLINKIGTQDSIYQKAFGGGQNWSNVKHFVLSNKNNPKFDGMTGSEIKKYLKNEQRLKSDLRDFIHDINPQEKIDLRVFINNIDSKEIINLRNFINNIDSKERIDLRNFINNIDSKEKSDLRSLIDRINSQEKIGLRNFISHIDLQEKNDLRNFINRINPQEKIDLRSFIDRIDPQEKIDLRSFINCINPQEKIDLRNFISHIKGEH